MNTYQTQFERFEYKYWIPDSQLGELLKCTAPYLRRDRGTQSVQRNTSLYFDSHALDFMKLHLDSAPDRFKLRVRSYGDPPSGPAFFEIKRKVKSVIFKNRAVVPGELVPALLRGEPTPSLKLQSAEEERTLASFFYLMTVYRAEPKVLVTCLRDAFSSRDPNEDVRLTLDHDISYQAASVYSLQGDPRSWLRLRGFGDSDGEAHTLIEVKFRNCAPWWTEELVRHLNLRISNYSKYVAAMSCEELGLERLFGGEPVANGHAAKEA